MTFLSKKIKWKNKKKRISYNIKEKSKYPRLIVFRSNKNISIQLLDDLENKTICSSSSIDKSLSKEISKSKNKMDMSKIVAENFVDKLKANNVNQVVFDRNGYRYHGRVKLIAETLREKGITI